MTVVTNSKRLWLGALSLLVLFALSGPAEGGAVQLVVPSPASGTVLIASWADTDTKRLDIKIDGRVVASCPHWWCMFSWSTETARNRKHTVRVIRYDARLKAAGSARMRVTTKNEIAPPTVTLTAPPTASGMVTLHVSAQGPAGISRTEIQVDGARVASGSGSALVYGWETKGVKNGRHTLRGVATDAHGNKGVSAIVETTVNNVDAAPPAPPPPSTSGSTAALPLQYVDTTRVPPSGQTISVPSGGDFQAALNAAQPGDQIVLQAGASYRGPFTLPVKTGSSWITIRSSAATQLPASGTRVTPAYSSAMPKLIAPAWDSAVVAAPGAHHYRFEGIEFSAPEGFAYNLVLLGNGETSESQLPHHLIFDRCYLHGNPVHGTRRGIAMNSRHTAVVDSHLSQFAEVGADSQAIAGWNGSGPFKIVNNYLEGAGENVMFGGADPSIVNLVPSDIEIRRNHFYKPMTWNPHHGSYEGQNWSVKNLFELKNARRVLVEENLLENNWVHSQAGMAVLFTVLNQNGTAPWSTVEDVTFRFNVVRNVKGGITIRAIDNLQPAQAVRRLTISHNLLYNVGVAGLGQGGSRIFLIGGGGSEIEIVHNTALGSSADLALLADGEPTHGFVLRDNILSYGEYGLMGSGQSPGNGSIAVYFPGSDVRRNLFIGAQGVQAATRYPVDHLFAYSEEDIDFVDIPGGDYALDSTSLYRGAATDGSDLGAARE